MAFCTRCGKQIEQGQACSCSANQTLKIDTSSAKGFLELMKNRMGLGDPERNASDCYERGKKIVPDVIRPNEGEIPVKQYEIATLRTLLKLERAEGHMQVTNKRVLFRAPGRSIAGRTTLQHEFAIDEIAGLEAQRNYKYSFLHFFGAFFVLAFSFIISMWITTSAVTDTGRIGFASFLALVFWIGGLVPFFLVYKNFLVKLLALGGSLGGIVFMNLTSMARTGSINVFYVFLAIVTLLVVLFCWFLFFMRPNLVVRIKNKAGLNDGPVDVSIKGTFFLEVIPTNESESAIRE